VPELPATEAQHRFHRVFRQFVGAIATNEHPLVLFLDDLQWLDPASLKLLAHVITDLETRFVLLVGAYRDNEVSPSHPLMRTLDEVRKAGVLVEDLVLVPLPPEHLGRLVADTVRRPPGDVAPLARLIGDKTGGNPFFTIQFLTSLHQEGLLNYDGTGRGWQWDLEAIRRKGYSDNVAELMVGKLRRLSPAAQEVLRVAACVGHTADVRTLALAGDRSEGRVEADLWEAVNEGLILPIEGAYRFPHDRVQEAAYSLIPQDERAATHLQIGKRLLAGLSPSEIEERVFDVANQLNRGADGITDGEDRVRAAQINLLAGRKAQAATAYATACRYLSAGAALLGADMWERQYELTFALEFHWAECEYLTGELPAATERLSMLWDRAASLPDAAAVSCARMNLYITLGQSDLAAEAFLAYLRRIDVHWSAHPTKDEVREEYEQIWRRLGDRPIENLIDLPPVTDPDCLATMDVLTTAQAAATFTDLDLFFLVIGRNSNLSLEHGNSDGSCLTYVWLGAFLGPYFGDYHRGFQIGKVGFDLVERRGLLRFKARVYLCFGYLVNVWTSHMRTTRKLLRQSFETAQETGDLTCAAYARHNLIALLLAEGEPLPDAQREAEAVLELVQQARFGLIINIVTAQLGLIRTLRGLTRRLGYYSDGSFDEGPFEEQLDSDPRQAFAICRYWIFKLQALCYAGDYPAALVAAAKAERFVWTVPAFLDLAEYRYHVALALAGHYPAVAADEQARYRQALADHHRQLATWAENCPENYANLAALIGAEIARLEGRELDAERLYEEAIHSARENGFVQKEGFAYERASAFYRARGFKVIADAYVREARSCYARWGADGKVAQLEQRHPHLWEAPPPAAAATFTARPEQLDLMAVAKASQAISREILLPDLQRTLMRVVVEHAGARRGALLLAEGDVLEVHATAAVRGTETHVRLELPGPAEATLLPLSVLNYVARTRASVVLADAAESDYSADDYVVRSRPRSVLCMPVIRQGRLAGALYLENSLTAGAFTPATHTALELLASQAAISLETAAVYAQLQQSESRFRRLADCGIIGIMVADIHGRVSQANDTFLAMTGYGRGDLPLRWDAMTPPEYRSQDERAVARLLETGTIAPIEKEFVRKDGGRVSVLIGATLLSEAAGDCMCFVLDVSERKRADEQLRASLREKEVLLKEVHHRVKNNLQFISSLMALQAEQIKDSSAAQAFTESRSRVRAMALVHEDLYRSRDLASVRLARHVEGLCAQLYRSYSVDPERIALDLRIADVALDLDRCLSCGLIIHELVSNAIKHAFPNGRAGRVTVQLEALPEGWYALSVADNGVGLPPGFDPARSDTLGLQLVADLAEQLGATFTLGGDGGATFTILFRTTGPGEAKS
jgi:PAS domain S-box-containing protein